MLLTDRCQVMLPNRCQCPNGVIDLKQYPDFDPTKCLLHNQLIDEFFIGEVADETIQSAKSTTITGE